MSIEQKRISVPNARVNEDREQLYQTRGGNHAPQNLAQTMQRPSTANVQYESRNPIVGSGSVRRAPSSNSDQGSRNQELVSRRQKERDNSAADNYYAGQNDNMNPMQTFGRG